MTSNFYCSTVAAEDGALWAVGLNLISDALEDDEAEALDQAKMNIVVTDGTRTWTRNEVTELDLGTVIPNRMRHALEALVNYNDQPTEEYTVKFTPQTGDSGNGGSLLLVEVEWDNKRHGKDLIYRVHFELDPAEDSKAEFQRVMCSAVDARAALRAEALRLEESCAGMAAVADAENKTLDEYAARKEELDGDAAIKEAALLAAQQAHLAEVLRTADRDEEAAEMPEEDHMSD